MDTKKTTRHLYNALWSKKSNIRPYLHQRKLSTDVTVCGILLQQTNESCGKTALISANVPFAQAALYRPIRLCYSWHSPRLYHLVFSLFYHALFTKSTTPIFFRYCHKKRAQLSVFSVILSTMHSDCFPFNIFSNACRRATMKAIRLMRRLSCADTQKVRHFMALKFAILTSRQYCNAYGTNSFPNERRRH